MDEKFPKIKVKTLSEKEIVLPDFVSGKVSLIGIAFVRAAQEMLDSWIEPFEESCEGGSVFEVPMIDGLFWRIFSKFIDEGMRSGIPAEKHDNVATFYGDTEEFRDELSMGNKRLGYIFLLDGEGMIRFKGEGYANEEGITKMLKIAKKSCESL